MDVKFVSRVTSTNSAGKPVEAIPVRTWVAGETDNAGRPIQPMPVTETANGAPVRVVAGKTAQNSIGQWLDTIPISGAGFLLAKGALVLCEGDSISSQVDGRSLAGWLSFASAGRLNFTTSLQGTPQVLAQAPAAVAAYPNLAAVIIHIGTNSLNPLTAAQIISDITQTIDI